RPILALTPTREIPIDAAQASWVIEHQQPAVSPRLDEDARFPGAALQREQGFQSACALPLTTPYRRLGSMHLAAKRPYVYSDEDMPILSSAADQVAMAIDNALTHTELQEEQDRRKLLLALSNAVMSNLELCEVLRAVTRSRCVLRSDSAVVALPDPASGQLRAHALDFLRGEEILQEGELIALDGTLAGHVFRTGTP